MKRIFPLVLFLIMLSSNVIPQSGWFQQNSGTTSPLNALNFLNEQTGFVSGGTVIYKTTDGGNTWQQKALPDTSSIQAIRFLNSLTGFACGGRYINQYESRQYLFKTTNCGESWTLLFQASGLMTHENFKDVFSAGNRIYLCVGGTGSMSTAGGLLVSTNAGASFNSITPAFGSSHDKLSFINEMTGYVSTTYSTDIPYMKRHIFKTTNGGSNWSISFRDTSMLNVFTQGDLNMMFTDANNGFALYNRGTYTKFAKTTNGGVSWDTAAFPYNKHLSLNFANANTGWVSGYYYPDSIMIMKTTNGGTNWFVQKKGIDNLFSMYFINDLTGWACGFNGKIYKTNTGGVVNEALDFFPMSAGNIYVYETPTTYPPYYNRNKITILKDSIMYGKKFYYFSNPLPGMWNYGNWYRVDSQTGLLTGYQPGYSCNNLANERRADSLYSRKGDTLRKCDGPQKSICKDTSNLSVLGIPTKQKIFREDGLILVERTFSKYFGITSVYTWEITGSTTFLVGCRINGITYGDTLLTGVENVSTEALSGYSLGQNYPNPFNASTVISFSLPVDSKVSIKVYDVQGREVQTLVNERLQAGTYETKFDGAGLNSGVYFYRLKAEGYSETKRMVLIK